MGSSPRGGSIGSVEIQNGSDTITSYSSSVNGNYHTGLKTPSPDHNQQAFRKDSVHSGLPQHSQSLPAVPFTTFDQSSGQYISMNQSSSYIDVSQGHMPSAIPSSAPPHGLGHYSNYQTSQSMQGAPQSYASSPTAYPHYAYSNGLAPLHNGGHPSAGSQLVQQGHPQLPSEFLTTSQRYGHRRF